MPEAMLNDFPHAEIALRALPVSRTSIPILRGRCIPVMNLPYGSKR